VSDRISADEVAKIARLARLALTDEELARATVELGDIVDHFADIDELDLDGVEPMTQPFPLTNVLRDDVEAPPLDRDEVLAAAPEVDDGRFKVPPIIGLEA
jgi:aspartyl-tRNA(Asn)/glutamyl-tRNA(Gln) amidotransferase subunit C